MFTRQGKIAVVQVLSAIGILVLAGILIANQRQQAKVGEEISGLQSQVSNLETLVQQAQDTAKRAYSTAVSLETQVQEWQKDSLKAIMEVSQRAQNSQDEIDTFKNSTIPMMRENIINEVLNKNSTVSVTEDSSEQK